MASWITRKTIARLAQPFDGGRGPTRSNVTLMFASAGADAYLPQEGNKYDLVYGGLNALLSGTETLPADEDMLEEVVDALLARLVAAGDLDPDAEDALRAPSAQTKRRVHSDELRPAPRRVHSDELRPSTARRMGDLVKGVPPAPMPAAGRTAAATVPSSVVKNGPIFVVHGHAERERHEVVRVLERTTNREVIVLHEQTNSGRTILEKFEHYAAGAAFAVVLLTADDFGAATAGAPKPRGRQNVIFELGFFFGRLGRERVAVLTEPGIERPSDIDGLVYIAMTDGSWQLPLVKELNAAGVAADALKIP